MVKVGIETPNNKREIEGEALFGAVVKDKSVGIVLAVDGQVNKHIVMNGLADLVMESVAVDAGSELERKFFLRIFMDALNKRIGEKFTNDKKKNPLDEFTEILRKVDGK